MLKINYGVCKEELKSLVVYNLEKSRNITIFFSACEGLSSLKGI